MALTHGQEWVNFYESFDLLVQDHLSRSSDLLRRTMSLPEVADREVAQVRDDLKGKLAAERERTNGLLTDLKTQITNSHRLASTLAMSIGSLMTDLHSLNARVDEAIQAAASVAPSAPAPVTPPVAPTGLLSASQSPAPAFAATPSTPGTDYLSDVASSASAPFDQPDAPATTGETAADSMTSEADALTSDAVASLADEPVMDVADLAEVADAGDEAPIDLTAIAVAEESSSDKPPAVETTAETDQSVNSPNGAGKPDTTPETGERQRPHWLSVTRVGASRP